MSDQQDFESLSRRLQAADFSADSRVRETLRARLLGRRAAPRFSPARTAALALAFGAAALLILFPLRSRLRRPSETMIATSVVLPRAPRLLPARRTAFPRGEHGLPVLPGVLAETAGSPESPLSSRAVDRVIDVRRGVVVREKDSNAVVWEFDGATYRLETRRVALEDLFETRRL